jgi:hypothetical protein
VIAGKGAVIGRFDRGQVTIKDPNPYDGTGPIVTGADRVEALGEKTTRYSGSNIRFRMIGGSFHRDRLRARTSTSLPVGPGHGHAERVDRARAPTTMPRTPSTATHPGLSALRASRSGSMRPRQARAADRPSTHLAL